MSPTIGIVAGSFRRGGGGGGPLPEPSSGTILARWKASTASATADGGVPGSVADSSGNGKTLTMFGVTYHVDGGYGDPVLRWASVDAATFPDVAVPTGGVTVLMVMRRRDSSSGELHMLASGSSGSFGGYITHPGDKIQITRSGVADYTLGTVSVGTGPRVLAYSYTDPGFRISLDGVVDTSTGTGTVAFGALNRLGYHYGDDFYAQIDVTDCIIFGPALTTSEEADWVAHLQSIYNSV